MNVKKITLSALLIALGTLTSHVVYIPVGVAKCFPIQHTINVISAVLLGPWYALSNAFLISLLRNILGTGSFLAFPGSMIGALLAGFMFKAGAKKIYALAGEIVGTGVIGGLLAFPVAKFIMGREVAAFFFVIPFLVSTIGGSFLAYVVLETLEKTNLIKNLFPKEAQ
jgi:energy coupling factor transporter S component ThiW